MRIGLLARADNGGLGIQTKEFYDHIDCAKVMLVDISSLNGNKIYPDRYKFDIKTNGFPTNSEIDEFLKDLDLVFTCEIPYNYYLYTRAKELGVKTVQQYNYEFLDHLADKTLPLPDLFMAPSLWNFEKVEHYFRGRDTMCRFVPVPVNREVLPFRLKAKARKFLHIAGGVLHEDRNGTEIVLKASKLIKSDAEIIIKTQHSLEGVPAYSKKIKIVNNDVLNYWDNYDDEDVLLLPRKFGGLSLQLNEAMSKGMVPIMTNVEPQSRFLHEKSLIDPCSCHQTFTRTNIDVWETDAKELAKKIDEFYNMTTEEFSELSEYSNEYAKRISWENMKKKYMKVFEELVYGFDNQRTE